MTKIERCDWCIRRCPKEEEVCSPTPGFGAIYLEKAERIPLMASSELPKEKKVLGVGPNKCILQCFYCGNRSVWEAKSPVATYTPEGTADLAKRLGALGVSTDFSEGIHWRKFLLNFLQIAKENGFYVILSTNGIATPEAMERLLPYFNALRIDLKGPSDEGYKRIAPNASDLAVFESVLRNIRTAKTAGKHVEVSTCLLPGYNSDENSLHTMAQTIVENAGSGTAWTIIPFSPISGITIPKPPVKVIDQALKIGQKEGLEMYLLEG